VMSFMNNQNSSGPSTEPNTTAVVSGSIFALSSITKVKSDEIRSTGRELILVNQFGT
jgi:hypothetical protein